MDNENKPTTSSDQSSAASDCYEVEPTAEWDKLYWAFNCPLQMWPAEGGHRVVNYMPRKESCRHLDCPVSESELPMFCANAAKRLRNLASLFEALGQRKINRIYYPDATIAELAAEFEEDKKESS